MQTRHAAVLVAIAGFAAISSAGPVSWWQPVNGSWSDVLRWSTQHLPDSNDDVTFPTPGPGFVVIDQVANARSLTIESPSTVLQMRGGSSLSITSGLGEAGAIEINSDSAAQNTSLFVGQNGANFFLTKTYIMLGATDNAHLDYAAVRVRPLTYVPEIVLTGSIHGSGNLYSNWNNAGTITADYGGHVLQFVDGTHSNSGTMSAWEGTLNFAGTGTLTQTGAGNVLADAGGTVNLGNTSVTGGTIMSNASSRVNIGSTAAVTLTNTPIDGSNGGLVTFSGPVTTNNCFFNIGAAGFEVSKGSTVSVKGASNLLGGTLTVHGNTVGQPATTFAWGSSGEIAGPTTFGLDAVAGYENLAVLSLNLSFDSSSTELHAGQTVRGAGCLTGTGRWINNGLMQADVLNRSLILGNNTALRFTNNSFMKAISGGILNISTSIQQGAGGRIIADTASSVVFDRNSGLSGGTVESVNGGSVNAAGFWGNVTLIGPINVPVLLQYSGTLTNNNTITVLGTLGPTGSSLNIDGTGKIFLKGTGFLSASTIPSTFGSSQVLGGTGTLAGTWINQGTIKPSSAANDFFVGAIGVTDKLTLAPSSRLEIETDTSFTDVVGTAGKGQIELGGTVAFKISLWNFAKTNTSVDFMRAASITGKFKTVSNAGNLTPPAGRAYRVYYQPTKTSLRVTCSADLDGDFQVDDTDFTYFVTSYNLLDCSDPDMPSECPADLNKDGVVNDADFVLFLTAYNKLLCF